MDPLGTPIPQETTETKLMYLRQAIFNQVAYQYKEDDLDQMVRRCEAAYDFVLNGPNEVTD